MAYERQKIAPWERYTDGEWHEVRRGPEGEGRDESLRQYHNHYQSMRAWCRLNGMRGQISRRENGRVLSVRIRPDDRPAEREQVIKAIRDKSRNEIGRSLIEAVQLLEYGLHLRMHGENAPGGTETWREFDQRTEAFLRQLFGMEMR